MALDINNCRLQPHPLLTSSMPMSPRLSLRINRFSHCSFPAPSEPLSLEHFPGHSPELNSGLRYGGKSLWGCAGGRGGGGG